MIHSDEFYRAFDAGFAPALGAPSARRRRGKTSRYRLATQAGDVDVWFRVNPKASAIPHSPGQFWPDVTGPATLRHGEQSDDGTVSWYQYASGEDIAAIQALRERVIAKVAAQQDFSEDVWALMNESVVGSAELLLVTPPEPRFPDTQLFYLDTTDAEEWGRVFAGQVDAWTRRFGEAPETLTMHMWRVHWSDE